jgi:hypothetical protein
MLLVCGAYRFSAEVGQRIQRRSASSAGTIRQLDRNGKEKNAAPTAEDVDNVA